MRDLIVFGEDWGRHPSSTQHLIECLSVNRGIFWVNSIGLRKPHLTLSDIKRLGQKWQAHQHFQEPLKKLPEKMTLLSPLAIPWPGPHWIEKVNGWWLSQQIQPKAAKILQPNPILWTSLPSAIAVVGHLKEKAVVYYCGDDFRALNGVDHHAIAKMEERLAQCADRIIATNEFLASRFPSQKTYIIPHGVDISLFTTAMPRPADLPVGLVAGFYGSIASWFDVELMHTVAQLLPNWQFVLIGKPEIDITALKKLPNIHFLGPKSYAELPAYVQHWQVSLLPFRTNAQIQASNPLKLREYLAVGKPIVTVFFPAVVDYREHVYIAETAQRFAAAIQIAATEDIHSQKQRQACVAQQTWQAQAAKVDKILAGLG
jgi:glycosyltransferase involved in cell wall biosynthesis